MRLLQKVQLSDSNVAVSPDSRWVVIQSFIEITLCEWNGTDLNLKWVTIPFSPEEREPEYPIRINQRLFHITGEVTFSPESDAVVTLRGREGRLEVLPIDEGEMTNLRCRTGRDEIRSFAISPDGVVATSCGNTVSLWSWSKLSPKGRYKPLAKLTHSAEVSDFAFSADGSRLVTTAYRSLRVWDVESHQCINRITASHRPLTAMAASPDGRLALTCTKDRIISLWELDTGKEISRFQFVVGEIAQLAFAPDGLTAVVRDLTSQLIQWDIDV